MAFADPLPITIAAATKNLVKVDSGKYTSEYLLAEATQSFRAIIRSQELKIEADGRKKARHNISIRQTIFATPVTGEVTRQASVTIEHYQGDDVTSYDDIVIALGGMLTAANVLKLNNFES